MEFSREDVTALLALVPLVLWQPSWGNDQKSREIYDMQRVKHNIRLALPGYVFGPAWLILYGLIVANGFIYFRDYAESNPFYLTTFILYLTNILLNKLWPLAFFSLSLNGRRYALLILIVLLLTGAAVVALQILSGATVPSILYGLYVAWLLYAMMLNIKWLWIPPCFQGLSPKYKSAPMENPRKAKAKPKVKPKQSGNIPRLNIRPKS